MLKLMFCSVGGKATGSTANKAIGLGGTGGALGLLAQAPSQGVDAMAAQAAVDCSRLRLVTG